MSMNEIVIFSYILSYTHNNTIQNARIHTSHICSDVWNSRRHTMLCGKTLRKWEGKLTSENGKKEMFRNNLLHSGFGLSRCYNVTVATTTWRLLEYASSKQMNITITLNPTIFLLLLKVERVFLSAKCEYACAICFSSCLFKWVDMFAADFSNVRVYYDSMLIYFISSRAW